MTHLIRDFFYTLKNADVALKRKGIDQEKYPFYLKEQFNTFGLMCLCT
jgi:hypothetical protein